MRRGNTPSEEVYRQLALYWGTFPARIDFAAGPDRTISAAEKVFAQKQVGYTWRPHGNRRRLPKISF
jgi:hypothetical protein